MTLADPPQPGMPLQLTLALYQGRKTEINATTSAPPIKRVPVAELSSTDVRQVVPSSWLVPEKFAASIEPSQPHRKMRLRHF